LTGIHKKARSADSASDRLSAGVFETKSHKRDSSVDLAEDANAEVEECAHSKVIASGGKRVCANCAACLESSDTTFSSVKDTKRKEAKNISKDLEKYSFPESVKARANEIFMDKLEGNTYRSSTRKAVIFACVHMAYKELGKAQDPVSIAKIIGIGKKEMSKG